MSAHHPPVEDWATDFDHTDPTWAADPYSIWADLRERCPIAHSERYGGVWLPTRHTDVSAIAYDTEHFTSEGVIVSETRPFITRPQGPAPPITSDPPFHQEARRLLLPAFSPKAVDVLRPFTRAYCDELLAAFDGADTIDAARDYAQHIPVRVIARMLGFPEADADLFREFVHHVLEAVDLPPEERGAGFERLATYIDAQVADHVANPRDDLTSMLLAAELDGAPLGPEHVRGTIILLLIAGIDTTWSAIGASLWHLAKTPVDRDRLVAEPELMGVAIEELLRAYAPVTMARLVATDTEMGGCPMRADDWVLLPFPAANRDPEFFDRADEVVIDRAENRHSTFGLGIHRCVGSNLARMELQVALEVWLEHFPTFSLAEPAAVRWAAGQVRGPRTLPIALG